MDADFSWRRDIPAAVSSEKPPNARRILLIGSFATEDEGI